MPDSTLSAALKEAYASSTGILYHTIELRHPNFTSPIRVVRDYQDLTARLEATAPENAGQDVLFVAFSFDFSKPEVSPNGVPQLTITIDNVSRDIVANIELATGSTGLIQVIYREFSSVDLSHPQNDPPITMDIMSVTATVFQVKAVAGFPNLMRRKFPTMQYSAEHWPGMIP